MGNDDAVGRNGTKRGSFLPNFCHIRNLFAVVVLGVLLAVVLSLGTVGSLPEFARELSLRSLLIEWIALAAAGLLCLLGPWLRRLSDGVAGLLAWGIVQLITLAVALGALSVLALPVASTRGTAFVIECLGVSVITTALLLRYLFMQRQWQRQMEAESEARFQALQSRIRPHFLFNSMNTIANLTRSNPEVAEEVVQDLSDLFRASLSDSRRMSTLRDELELARGYLRIESQRLGDRLRVEWDLEQLPEQARLPALVLQPLLENAVYHGIECTTDPGTISIAGRYRRQRVNLSIRNTLPLEPAAVRPGNRMALDNIRQRLQGFFSGEANLTQGEVDGEHQIRLVFPYPWKA